MGKRIPVVITERLQLNLPEDEVSPQNSDATTKNYEPNSQPSSVVDKNSADKHKEKADDGEESHYSNIPAIRVFFQRNPPTPQGFFNLVVMVSTVLLSLITKWQYDVQLLDQRAWVGPSKFRQVQMVPDTDVSFCVEITNSGKTPAIRFTGLIAGLMQSAESPLTPIYDYGPFAGPKNSVSTLFPGASVCLETPPMKFPPSAVEFLKSDNGVLYIYGRVEYDDIFRVSHCTTFCGILKHDLTNFSACPTYNDNTDTKCDKIK